MGAAFGGPHSMSIRWTFDEPHSMNRIRCEDFLIKSPIIRRHNVRLLRTPKLRLPSRDDSDGLRAAEVLSPLSLFVYLTAAL